MNTIIPYLLFISGFLLLIKGADIFVDGAASLAIHLKIKPIVVGLTVVAFGTSTPELSVNIFTAITNTSEIALSNIIGSNIVNIFLILSIAGLIRPLTCKKNTIWKEIPFSLIAAISIFIMCNDFLFNNEPNMLNRNDGLILLLFFIIFVTYTFAISKINVTETVTKPQLSKIKIIIFLVTGLTGLVLGGNLVINNAVIIAKSIGISNRIIGLTIVAIGTSLPELFTSAIAAYKGESDIAIGNVVGSNIFNIFLILGVTAIISPIPFDTIMNIDLYILLTASFLLFVTMFSGKKKVLDRWEAIIFLCIYLGYNIFLFLE